MPKMSTSIFLEGWGLVFFIQLILIALAMPRIHLLLDISKMSQCTRNYNMVGNIQILLKYNSQLVGTDGNCSSATSGGLHFSYSLIIALSWSAGRPGIVDRLFDLMSCKVLKTDIYSIYTLKSMHPQRL